MEAKKKLGWSEFGIVGFIFLPLGLIFLILGICLWAAKAGHDPNDPKIFLCVFGGMGLLFTLIALGLLSVDLRRRAGMRRAINNGEYVMAKVTGVQAKTNIRINGSSPWVVECQYQDPSTGAVHVFHSRPLRFNPSELVLEKEVPVYINRFEPKETYVDIDAILPEIVVHR